MKSELPADIPYEILQGGGFVGPGFTAVFFFEGIFWRVVIPLIYGQIRVDTLAALRIMPAEIKKRLCSLPSAVREYLLFWGDCHDYHTGFEEAHHLVAAGSFAAQMVESTGREISSAIADLSQPRPNSKAMHTSRDAVEKALKAYLAHHANLTGERAKKDFSHKLDKLLQEIGRIAPESPLARLSHEISAFASYDARYSLVNYSRPELWRVYRLAQFTAAEVMRSISGRNQRAVMQSHPVFANAKESV